MSSNRPRRAGTQHNPGHFVRQNRGIITPEVSSQSQSSVVASQEGEDEELLVQSLNFDEEEEVLSETQPPDDHYDLPLLESGSLDLDGAAVAAVAAAQKAAAEAKYMPKDSAFRPVSSHSRPPPSVPSHLVEPEAGGAGDEEDDIPASKSTTSKSTTKSKVKNWTDVGDGLASQWVLAQAVKLKPFEDRAGILGASRTIAKNIYVFSQQSPESSAESVATFREMSKMLNLNLTEEELLQQSQLSRIVSLENAAKKIRTHLTKLMTKGKTLYHKYYTKKKQKASGTEAPQLTVKEQNCLELFRMKLDDDASKRVESEKKQQQQQLLKTAGDNGVANSLFGGRKRKRSEDFASLGFGNDSTFPGPITPDRPPSAATLPSRSSEGSSATKNKKFSPAPGLRGSLDMSSILQGQSQLSGNISTSMAIMNNADSRMLIFEQEKLQWEKTTRERQFALEETTRERQFALEEKKFQLEEKIKLGSGKENSSADLVLFGQLKSKYDFMKDLESLEDYQALDLEDLTEFFSSVKNIGDRGKLKRLYKKM